MKEIQNRADVFLLVSNFYAQVRRDDLLAPIFKAHIAEDEWGTHLERLTDFWVTNLFGIACFKGNPMRIHRQVDQNLDHKIDQVHFSRWLQLWFKTIDSLFEGSRAQRAKDAARKMSTGLFLAIWNMRPEDRKV